MRVDSILVSLAGKSFCPQDSQERMSQIVLRLVEISENENEKCFSLKR